MIVGIGIDVVEIERFAETLRRSPAVVERLFLPAEAELAPGSLAGRFAAKEALAKALGAPAGLHWVDVETYVENSGQPRLAMRGTVLARATELGVVSSHVSISHDGGIASSVVVLEGRGESEERAGRRARPSGLEGRGESEERARPSGLEG